MGEFADWLAYEQEVGPLNLGLRLEAAIARAVRPFLKPGGEVDRYLMPWPREREPDEPSIGDAFALLSRLGTGRK